MASSAKDIQLRELKDTISQLKTMVSEQTELIKSLRLIIDEKSSHEKALQEQVDYLTKKLFGSSSERRSNDIPGQQNLFDEAEVEQDPSLLEETVIKEHTRKKKATHEDLFKGLKVEKVVIPLPEEEQICPVCGTQMVLIGEEYVRRELECDYSKAVDALENMAERIYRNSEKLIKELGGCKDRKKVIESWENMIIGFYSKKSGMKILEAQLCNAYLARCKNNSMLGENNIEYGVTIWCRNYYFQKFQDEISIYEKAQEKYADLLSRKEMLSIKCQIDEIKKNRKQKEKEIKSNLRRNNVNAENIFRYKNYYILEMSRRYRSFIPKIKDEQLTMLPHELMQYIIEADFKEISLE